MLLASRRGVSRARLREVVPAYAASPSDEAFERMFERDKDELRSLGVPVETVALDVLHDDETGYRIDPGQYELPPVSFTREETVALGLAARAWSRAGLAGPARDALLKLEALGQPLDLTAVDVSAVAIEPWLGSTEPALPGLHAALADRQVVRFDYRKPGQSGTDQRTLEPWGILTRRGRSYVVGHDRLRDGVRVFRVGRIVGELRPVGRPGAYTVPHGLDLAAMVAPVDEGEPQGTAVVDVAEGRGGWLRRRATAAAPAPDGTSTRIELPYRELARAAAELAGLGADVVVVEPAALREAVVARLRAVLA